MRLPKGVLNFLLRTVEKPHLRRATDIRATRRRFSRQARIFFHAPAFSACVRATLGARQNPAVWISVCRDVKPGIILYFHGGAYCFGTPETHQAMLAHLSGLTGIPAVLPDYRMAPEHPFPAAVEDALDAYLDLIARGYRPERIILGGDSAGGGLMLALLHEICSKNMPRPGAAFAFSPWSDLTLSGPSLRDNAARDAYLPAERIIDMRDTYLDGAPGDDPRASPLFGCFSGAPPVMIAAADTEILLDDARRMAENLKKQGVDAKFELWHDLPHVWPIFQGYLREADEALAQVADFIASVVKD